MLAIARIGSYASTPAVSAVAPIRTPSRPPERASSVPSALDVQDSVTISSEAARKFAQGQGVQAAAGAPAVPGASFRGVDLRV